MAFCFSRSRMSLQKDWLMISGVKKSEGRCSRLSTRLRLLLSKRVSWRSCSSASSSDASWAMYSKVLGVWKAKASRPQKDSCGRQSQLPSQKFSCPSCDEMSKSAQSDVPPERQLSQKCCRLTAFGSAFLKSGFTYTTFLPAALLLTDYFLAVLLACGDYFSVPFVGFLDLSGGCQNWERLSSKLYLLLPLDGQLWVFLGGGLILPLQVAEWMANSLLTMALSQRAHWEVLDSHCLKWAVKSLAGTLRSQYSQYLGFMRQVLAWSSASLFLVILAQWGHLAVEWNSSSWSSRKFLSYISPQVEHLTMFLRQQPKCVADLDSGMALPQFGQVQVYSIINKINGQINNIDHFRYLPLRPTPPLQNVIIIKPPCWVANNIGRISRDGGSFWQEVYGICQARWLQTIVNSIVQMQKVVESFKTADQPREQEFSFVAQNSKGQHPSLPIDPALKLAREPHPVQRPFELTFQRECDSAVGLLPLKREQNYHGYVLKAAEVKGEREFEGKQSALRQQQIVKTEHSSSDDDYNEGDRRPIRAESNGSGKVEPMKAERLSYLIKKSDSHEFVELNCELPDVYESQILLNKNIEDYAPDRANICGADCVQFSKFKISLGGISKLKIYPVIVKKKSFRIKIGHEKEVYNMGVQLRRELYYLPEHYIWFAKLVNARLMRMGCGVGKGGGSGSLHTNGIFNQGFIYKCSKYRKKWEKRFILINNEGLFSYKNPKENYTVHIPTAAVEELWTNFELHAGCLVIKLRHKGDKTEFAIPVLDYCLREDSLNWLFSFYRLLMEHKIHIKI